MTQKELYIKYWKILDHLEDSVRGEFRDHHPEPSQFPEMRLEKKDLPEKRTGTPSSVDFSLSENCGRCPLSRQKKVPVPGIGSLKPLVMVVLDPPDHNAEKEGLPCIPSVRDFMDKWFESIRLNPAEDVYYTSVVKCRAPGNRPPFPDEAGRCLRSLEKELDDLKPKALFAAGEIAGKLLTGLDLPVPELRKTTHRFRDFFTLVTFPPGDVLVNPQLKRPVWEDLKNLRNWLDEFGVS